MQSSFFILLLLLFLLPTPVGAKIYKWVDEQGHTYFTDNPEKIPPQYRSHVSIKPQSPVQERTKVQRTVVHFQRQSGAILVNATLNHWLSTPFVLDTGASFTVISKAVAEQLRIRDYSSLRTREFLTANGKIQIPVTTLSSIRLGNAEVQNVDVAIDTSGSLPVGLLGLTFLRMFHVTVDSAKGELILVWQGGE